MNIAKTEQDGIKLLTAFGNSKINSLTEFWWGNHDLRAHKQEIISGWLSWLLRQAELHTLFCQELYMIPESSVLLLNLIAAKCCHQNSPLSEVTLHKTLNFDTREACHALVKIYETS